jgi:dihydrofolate reductase
MNKTATLTHQFLKGASMRKVVMLNRISIDGFFAEPNGEIDWFIHDPEVDKALHKRGQADTVLLGRVTYQMFESYWPKVTIDPDAPAEAKATANELNQMTKVVFSTTLPEVTWENSRIVRGNIIEEVKKLKQGSGTDMLIFGSGTIVQQLTDEGLIDDYFFVVTPVILGIGKSLFHGTKKLDLKLLKTTSFRSGNVILQYEKRQGSDETKFGLTQNNSSSF